MSMTLDPGMAQYFVTELKHTWCRPTSRVTRVHAKVTVNTAENYNSKSTPQESGDSQPRNSRSDGGERAAQTQHLNQMGKEGRGWRGRELD